MISPTIFLLAAVFLLFPLAHLRLIESFPMYLSEVPLLLSLGWFALQSVSLKNLRQLFTEQKRIFLGATLFFIGALAPFFLKDVPIHSLGLFKSFIALPIFFALVLAHGAQKKSEQQLVLFFWWLGIVTSALVGGILFLNGILTYDGRLASFYASPNHFAMLLSPGILLGIFLFGANTSRWRFLYGIGMLIILGALFATKSYASLGAVIVASMVLGFSWKEKMITSWKKFFLIVICVLVGWVFVEGSTEKFQSLFDFSGRSSSASRLMIWESAGKISHDHFPWGIGIGRFQETYLAYQVFFPPYLEWAVPEPHNLFLSLFLATGLLGLLGILLVFKEIIFQLWKICLKENEASLAYLYLSIFVWVILVGLVDTPYFRNDLSLLVWGVIGLAVGFLEDKKRQSRG